mmetsp:Transcript_22576/g.33011  ORF Transcript_22576/g.33011 Transcript_22576/m.33011 type:complete len:175 (-) Transcript_22576:49-573(-)
MNSHDTTHEISSADITINIFPGVNVQSGYYDEKINSLSQKIIRIAVSLCAFQILITLVSLINFSVPNLIWSCINIVIYCLICYYAISCVKRKNEVVCCGCTALHIYRIYLYIAVFILFLSLAASVWDVVAGYYWRVVDIVILVILLSLNIAEIVYARMLLSVLAIQVHPEDSPL